MAQTRIAFKTESYCLGFTQSPEDLEDVLAECGFNRIKTVPIRATGAMATLYAPDSASRNRPVFSFTTTPVGPWERVTGDEIVAEAVVEISFPVDPNSRIKYDQLMDQIERRYQYILSEI